MDKFRCIFDFDMKSQRTVKINDEIDIGINSELNNISEKEEKEKPSEVYVLESPENVNDLKSDKK